MRLRSIALLRGINVGGKNILPMKSLAALFENAGCRDVATVIQSGNVVFRAEAALTAQLPELIRKAILRAHQIDVPVILRSAAELKKIAARHPHLKPGTELKLLYVGFLAKRPGAAKVAALDPKRSPEDVYSVHGREVYVRYSPAGSARSKFTNQYIDTRLGTVSTLRNWNTVLKLNDLAQA